MNKEKQFALICYLILMQGLERKSPKYIEEKYKMLTMGYFAIQKLHPTLRKYVVEYYKEWNLEFSKEAKEFIS